MFIAIGSALIYWFFFLKPAIDKHKERNKKIQQFNSSNGTHNHELQ